MQQSKEGLSDDPANILKSSLHYPALVSKSMKNMSIWKVEKVKTFIDIQR